jgi:hypothetical protein
MVSVTTLTGVHRGMNLATGITAKYEAKLFSCPVTIRIEPNLTSTQRAYRDDDRVAARN